MNGKFESEKFKFVIFNIFMLMFYLFVGEFNIIKLLSDYARVSHYMNFFVMGTLFLSSSILATSMLFIKNTKWPVLLLLFLSLSIECSYRQINGYGFTFNEALLIFQEWSTRDEVIRVFLGKIIIPVIISILTIFLICRLLNTVKIIFTTKQILGILTLFLTVNLLMYRVMSLTNANRDTFPLIYKTPLILTYAYNNKLYIGNRKKVAIPHTNSAIQHIVLIVDESVRGDMQSLNGYKIDTTPFLKSIQHKIFNYGVTSSGTNFSSYSNNLLMTGLPVYNLPDKNQASRKIPTIFDYAKNANYRTFLLAAQNTRAKPANFLMARDYKAIDDTYFVFDDKANAEPEYMGDYVALNKLVKYIRKNDGNKTFTYFIKHGSHFIYENRYPQDKKYFYPALSEDDNGKWDKAIRPKFLNSYYNTIKWGVDDFFVQLYEQLQGTNSLIIYTSDHGQNLIDDLEHSQTHAMRGKAPKETANVPLFMIPLDNETDKLLTTKYLAGNLNHASHFNIFPTLIELMGYKKSAIDQEYGPSLFDNLHNQCRIFVTSDIYGRGGYTKNYFDVNSANCTATNEFMVTKGDAVMSDEKSE